MLLEYIPVKRGRRAASNVSTVMEGHLVHNKVVDVELLINDISFYLEAAECVFKHCFKFNSPSFRVDPVLRILTPFVSR